MYKALYRAYRPEVFSQVLGQDHIVKVLQNQIKTGRVDHAYLFCGTRGTGKTTVARILAKAVNCTASGEAGAERPCGKCENCMAVKDGSFMDLIEIDGASNNGVDNIREIRESVNYPPAIGRMKVYIIDEVHMLSTGAFNALLKTLEEPPEHVMFILATTEPQKLPNTIISRCIRMDFRRASEETIAGAMADILKDHNIAAEESALRLMAMQADGSIRDGLTVLDRVMSAVSDSITEGDVLSCLGIVGETGYLKLTNAVISHRPDDAIMTIKEFLDQGKDSRSVLQGWMAHYRNLMMVKLGADTGLGSENEARLKEQSDAMTLDCINSSVMDISQAVYQASSSTQPRVILEVCAIRLSAEETEQRVPEKKYAAETSDKSRTPKSRAPEPAKEEYAKPAEVSEKQQSSEPPKQETVKPPEENTKTEIPEPKAPALEPEDSPVSEAGDEAVMTGDTAEIWQKVFEELTTESPHFLGMGDDIKPLSFDGTDMVLGIDEYAYMTKELIAENLSAITEIFRKITGASGKVAIGEDIKEPVDSDREDAAVRAFNMIAGSDSELEIR